MANMNRVVNTQTNSEHNVDAGDDVNGDAPDMEETNNICESADHNDDDHEADLNVTKKKKGNNKYTDHSQANVPPEFITNDSVCLPGSIDPAVAESIRRVCSFDQISHCPPGWNVLLGTRQLYIAELELCCLDSWCWLVTDQVIFRFKIWFVPGTIRGE